MFILEFKHWIEEELLIEALLSLDKKALYSKILNRIETNPSGSNINQLISSITKNINIKINNDTFLKTFLTVVLRRAFQSKDFNSIIDDNFFNSSKQDKKLHIDAAIGYISMFLKDLDEKLYIFREILSKYNGDLTKSINDFLTNPRGIHSHLGLEDKPLFKKLLQKPPSQIKQNAQGGFDDINKDDENQYIPTYDETLPRRDASAGSAASAVKPRAEFDDEARIKEQEFQRRLLSVTPDEAKENLNINMEIFLDANKNNILNPANLEEFAKDPQSKKPEINKTNNYLKIKALYDISTKFTVEDKDGKIPIGELEGHSKTPAYQGKNPYSTLPDRKDFFDSDSYFSKLNGDQWINLISKYILSHYNTGKNPKIPIGFFRNLFGAPTDIWSKTVDDAVKKSKDVKKDLLEKDFPLTQVTQDDFEIEDAKFKKDKERFKRTWLNMSGRLSASAKSDLEKFLPVKYQDRDEDGDPKKQGMEEGEFDKDGRDIVVKILDDFYYNKFYGNTSAKVEPKEIKPNSGKNLFGDDLEKYKRSQATGKASDITSGNQIDDKEKEVQNKSHNFQILIKLYRVLLGLSAIEVARVDVNILPICKQLQIWMDFSFRDPSSNASIEELNKIKEIKKIKELLKVNKNIISNIFNKPLEDICNNERFEDEFNLEDEDAIAREKRQEYSVALASGYFTGGKLTFQDFLALKNSKNKEDIEEYKALIRKGEKSLKGEMPLDRKKREEYLRIAREIALNKGINNPNTIDAIAEKLKKGVPMESPLWHDLQSVKYKFTPTQAIGQDFIYRAAGSGSAHSAYPQLPETERIGSEWKPIEPKEPDPKEKEQMIAAAKQRAQAAADQRRAYYARNLNKDTGEIR